MAREITAFGKKLYLLMARKGINPGEFAQRAGIRRANLTQLRRTKTPRPKMIHACAKALGVDVEVFFE